MTNTDYQKAWTFAGDALNGTGGFYDCSYIDKFGRESDESFINRKDISKNEYENIVSSKVTRYNGYLYKDAPVRQTDNELISTIVKDADRKGNGINVFMSAFTSNAKIRGVNLVLVDMPVDIGLNLGEQIDNRLTPYFTEILPERVTSFKLDKFGKFEYVAFSDTIDNSTFEEESVTEVIRYFDRNEWKVFEGDKVIDEGIHSLGVCPLIIFSENGKFLSTGEFYQLSGMSKKILNLESEMKNLMRGQAFSLLTAQKTDGSSPSIDVGVNNVLFYTGSNQPGYISSDAAQAAIYKDKLVSIKDSANTVSYDEPESSTSESGLSKQLRFQSLNASLAKFAQRVENFEKQMFYVSCLYLNLPKETIEIIYNMDFNINDINEEITNLDAINSIVDLPQYRAAKLKKIVTLDLPSLGSEELDNIYMEIDINSKESEIDNGSNIE